MKKLTARIMLCLMIPVLLWCGSLLRDRRRLKEELIRIHVVANSDSREDQSLKLQVKDAVMGSLRRELENVADTEQAKEYLEENLPKLKTIAQRVLQSLGSTDSVEVYLDQEAFDARSREDYALPAGVYNALRIIIGDGAGENWWCVVFPVDWGKKNRETELVTVGGGFHTTGSQQEKGEYQLRFACLEALGRLENFFFRDQ